MKLEQEIVDLITKVISIAKNVNADVIIIEQSMIRGIDDERTIVILETDNIPKLPFDCIAIPQIPNFINRLNIANTYSDISFDVDVDPNKGFVQKIKMKTKRFKVEFRCANPEHMKVPKGIKDEFTHSVTIDEDTLQMIKNGRSAMATDVVSLLGTPNDLTVKLIDNSNDEMEKKLIDCVEKLNDGQDKFAFRYSIDLFLSIFKGHDNLQFQVGSKGILRINNEGIGIYILPRVST